MKLKPDKKKYFDHWGMITEISGEGGDSAFTTSHYYFSLVALSFLDLSHVKTEFLYKIISSEGLLRRHPDETKWYADWDRGSRDQYRAVINFISYMNLEKLLKSIFKSHLKRGLMFASNTRHNWVTKDSGPIDSRRGIITYKWKIPDIMGPSVWPSYLRGFRKDWRIILTILDIYLIFGSLNINLKKDKTNVMNHLSSLFLALEIYPTLTAKIAAFILNKNDMIERVKKYWGPDAIGSYREPWFMIPILEKTINKYL